MKKLAAFVITYERPETLLTTVDVLFKQTHKPDKLLIVDNSISNDTQDLVSKNFIDLPVAYHRMGYNAGPAGAAKFGLLQLASEGFQWIYWGDDNDPPIFVDAFEQLLNDERKLHQAGILALVGQYFDPKTGNIVRVKDEMLEQDGYLEVDVVGGGMTMIVSARAVLDGALPDEELFFGFEELDLCLTVKRLGYKIFVNRRFFLRSREYFGKLGTKKKFYKTKTLAQLRREYYSLRNLLIIAKKNRYQRMLWTLVFKWLIKSFFGFSRGWKYGLMNFKYIWLAFFHFALNKKGNTVPLKSA